MRSWLLIAAICLADIPVQAFAPASQGANHPITPGGDTPNLLVNDGYIMDVRDHEDGAMSFGFSDPYFRIIVRGYSDAELERLMNVAIVAYDAGVAITFRYNVDGGAYDTATNAILFPLCGMDAQGQGAGSDEICLSEQNIGETENRAEGLVSSGIGHAWALEPETARRYLDAALARNNLSDPLERIARRARARILDDLAYQLIGGDPEADQLRAAALDDFRAAPADDPETLLLVGWILERLGAYGEALETFDLLLDEGTDWAFRRTMARAAIMRLRGDFEESLAEIDSLGLDGIDEGMMFNYHRAWTLIGLGRYEEAIANIDLGLGTQSDYSYAYLRRSCALASMGRITEALADERRGHALLHRPGNGGNSAQDRWVLEQADERLALLIDRSATAPTDPMPEICGRFDSETWRERSPLIGPRIDINELVASR